jgi:four helix bundle protein
MRRVKELTDIEAWRKARDLAGRVYRTTNSGLFRRDFGLKDQIRRAAVSVMANIAEGFGRKSHKDFARFLYTSKASAVEVTSHLYLASDLEYLDQDALEEFLDGYDHIQRMLMNLIKHLESK